MSQELVKPIAMELGEDGDTILVFGKCSENEAGELIRELLSCWDDPPPFDLADLEHLPVVVEGTPVSQQNATYPDTAYWWGEGETVSIVNPTRVSEGWLLYLDC